MNYELTQTLRPQLYHYTAQEQFNLMYKSIYELSKKWKMTTVTELTKENNVHYHSKVFLKDRKERDKLLNDIRKIKQIGKKTCDTITYDDSYNEYMFKHVHITAEIIEDDPVIYDHFNLNKTKITYYLTEENNNLAIVNSKSDVQTIQSSSGTKEIQTSKAGKQTSEEGVQTEGIRTI